MRAERNAARARARGASLLANDREAGGVEVPARLPWTV